VDGGVTMRPAIDSLLPERLHRLRQLSGVPVVFAGTTHASTAGRQLVLGRLAGTVGSSLHGLVVRSGRGLGGSVLRSGETRRVDDYATTTDISHEYDRIVVQEERLTSMFAVPVVVQGAVSCVLYGAVRDHRPIGDRAVRAAEILAGQLRQDAENLHESSPQPRNGSFHAAVEELADVIRQTTNPALRARLTRIHATVSGPDNSAVRTSTVLAPREQDALRLVATGASNLEIAARLGLSPQTVKAYLRTAMRKLDVHNRTAAVHAAREARIL
jgi:LuxR family transcriptional regulator, regulator of acetate metabolism